MNQPMRRLLALSVCLCAAAALFTAALLWTPPDARSAAGTEQTVVIPQPEPGQGADTPSEDPSEPLPPTIYVLRSVDGELCVFRGRKLLRRTGVRTSTLPREDRTMLETGISAGSQEALASLLEDLSS